MAATIKDVAAKAGVSIATVSHVLNKTRFVSDGLATRVHEAVKELGYYPNLLVGSLRKKRTFTVGLVIPYISNETFGHLAEAIQKLLFKQQYNLIICNTSYDLAIEEQAFNTLLMKKVDAMIVIPTTREASRLQGIQNLGVPVVLIDRIIPGLKVDVVRVDNVKGTCEAVRHLIDLGHRRIGYIDRHIDHSHSLDHKKGYRQALEENGIAFDMERVVRAEGYDYHSGAMAVKALLKKDPSLTAVFAYYDIMAFGAIRGAADLGLRVPQDLSVVGCDAMPFTAASIPRLTTISFPIFKIARVVCDLVLERLERRGEFKEREIVIAQRLVVRDSTAPPRPG